MKLLSLLGISSGCIVIALVFTMVNTALPVIQRDLGVATDRLQWMMMAFGIINCALLVTSGRLADIFGRKKVFLIGLTFSGAGMILGGWSTESLGLIVSMSLAGVGNAILLPVSQAMLVSEYPEEKKSHAIAIWATAIACAMASGPLLGGIISSRLGWPWVFWSLVPVVFMSFVLTTCFSKESKNLIDHPAVDFLGIIFLGLGLSSFTLLVSEYNHFSYPIRLFLLVVSISSFLGLWKSCRTFHSPILLPELLRKRIFIAASMASGCLVYYIWATFFVFPLFLQNVLSFSPLQTGLMMLAVTIPVALLAPIVGKIFRKNRGWKFIFAGFVFLTLSALLQRFFGAHTSPSFILLTFTFFGVGYGLIMGPTATLAVSATTPNKAGIASGTFVTFQEIGGTLGLAFVVTAVRLKPTMIIGFHEGALSLLIVSIIGCACALMLKTSNRSIRR